MTYMDVRFLVDDLNLTLVDEDEPVVPDGKDEGVKSEASSGTPC